MNNQNQQNQKASKLLVVKRVKGGYQWATKEHGVMSHSKLEEAKKYARRNGYKFKVTDAREAA